MSLYISVVCFLIIMVNEKWFKVFIIAVIRHDQITF